MLISDHIEYWSILIIGLFLILCNFFKKKKFSDKGLVNIGLFILIFLIILASFYHKIPYFYNWQIFHKYSVGNGSEFSLWINFDKFIFIYIASLFFIKELTPNNQKLTLNNKYHTIILFISTILFLMIPSLLIGLVKIEVKFDYILPLWALNNLLIVCVAEELFFRGFLQRNLTNYFYKFKNKENISIFITSFIFATLHLFLSWKFALISFFASIFYGLAFKITKDIKYPILLHFLVNLTHFIFFSYPYLA